MQLVNVYGHNVGHEKEYRAEIVEHKPSTPQKKTQRRRPYKN